jgi:hypothetical protein
MATGEGEVLGALLRRARLEAGLTLSGAAARSNVSLERLVACEVGDRYLYFGDLLALLCAYDMSLRRFFVMFDALAGIPKSRARDP